jgi:ABC-type nitrate/sulfonate/bicarbonate transport system permease component
MLARNPLVRLLPGIAFLAVVLGILELATRVSAVNPAVVPPPSAVLTTFGGLIRSGAFARPLLETFVQLAAGFGIGCSAGIALGILMGAFRPVYNLFEPITELLRPIPKPALLPVLMLFLGLGPTMKISIVALSAFFPVLITTVQGARSVDPVLTDMARTFGYGRSAILRKILLPATMPYILEGMSLSLGISMVVVVVAEMLSGQGGIGYVLMDNQQQFRVRETYGWVVVLALFGLALNGCFTWLERRLIFWHAPSSQ